MISNGAIRKKTVANLPDRTSSECFDENIDSGQTYNRHHIDKTGHNNKKQSKCNDKTLKTLAIYVRDAKLISFSSKQQAYLGKFSINYGQLAKFLNNDSSPMKTELTPQEKIIREDCQSKKTRGPIYEGSYDDLMAKMIL